MSKKPPPQTPKEVVDVLDKMMDSVPLDDAEVDLILREARIDASAELQRAMSLVDDAERRSKESAFARAEAERMAALGRISTPRRRRSRSELQARLAHLRQIAPQEAQPQAYFKNFESASDEDLERTVSDFEHLLGLDDDDK